MLRVKEEMKEEEHWPPSPIMSRDFSTQQVNPSNYPFLWRRPEAVIQEQIEVS